MNFAQLLITAIAIFVAFSIGLNLGLHGILSLNSNTHQVSPQLVEDHTVHNTNTDNGQITKNMTVPAMRTDPISNTMEHIIIKIPPNAIPEQTVRPSIPVSLQTTSVQNHIHQILTSTNYVGQIKNRYNQTHTVAAENEDMNLFTRKDGLKLPILLMTCNRVALLEQTILSLLSVRGVTSENILVSQDGSMQEIADVLQKYSLDYIQNKGGVGLRGGIPTDGAARIAMHYKFSLSAVFRKLPNAPAVIIVEDDLLFSPDFYEFFHHVSPVLEKDKSVFLISAWNDNGFTGLVKDPHMLMRTEFFPGLGWLLPRALYLNELEEHWPSQHWDHWLRSSATNKGREIVYPQVPRSFHNGIKGTFMNLETHNKYFKNIAYNKDSEVSWMGASGVDEYNMELYGQTYSSVYEHRIQELIRNCNHVNSFQDLVTSQSSILCVWINVDPDVPDRPQFEPVASFFGIWHEHKRGGHHGLHEFYWETNYVMILNIWENPILHQGGVNYKSLKPESVKVLEPRSFDKRALMEIKRKANRVEGIAAASPGISCDTVCMSLGKSCNLESLRLLNTCEAVNALFPCHNCEYSQGPDQPAFVSLTADSKFSPGKCLINDHPEMSACSASHEATIRLCACA